MNEHVQQAPRAWTRGGLLPFVWAFVAVALSIGAWALATPLGSAPDEGEQWIQAAAAVRGQLHDQQFVLQIDHTPIGRAGLVEVPKWIANGGCFAPLPNVPADCSPGIRNDTTRVRAASPFSEYPRLYYLIVGVPSLLSTGSGALYGMRDVTALLDAGLIALGLFLLAKYHPRRLSMLGAMVALSPMLLFICAVVNPSGLETAAGFASWCGGLSVVERTVIPRSLAALTSLAFVLLILSRPTSPVNAAVIVAVLAVFVGRRRARALLSERSFRPVWISVTGAVLLAGFSLVFLGIPSEFGAPEKPPLSFLGVVWLVLRGIGGQLRQCIGDFGSGEPPTPNWVVIVWTLVLAGLLIFGLAVSRRGRRALPLLVLGMLVMLVIFEAPEVNPVGFYWQARYWLPLAVGLPLLASAVEPRKIYRRARAVAVSPALQLAGFVSVLAVLIVAQLGAFLTSLHHYETGLGAPAGSPEWAPPGGTTLAVSLLIAGQILLLGFLTWSYRDPRRTSMTGVRSNTQSAPPIPDGVIQPATRS